MCLLAGDGPRPRCCPRPGRIGRRRPGSAPPRVAAALPAPRPGRAAAGAGAGAGPPSPRPRPQVGARHPPALAGARPGGVRWGPAGWAVTPLPSLPSRWPRAPLRPHRLRESQGEEAEGAQDEVSARPVPSALPLSPSLSLCLLHATRALLRLLLGCSASPSCPPDPPPASPGSSSGTATD